MLIAAGANVNTVNEWGTTPLIYAISSPVNIGMVQYLLSKGANVNQASQYGKTPLMVAATFEGGFGTEDKLAKLTAAKILLKAGADPNVVDLKSKNALQYAIDTNFNDMIKLLLPVSVKN